MDLRKVSLTSQKDAEKRNIQKLILGDYLGETN
jgi:hypothetical protein